MGIFDSLGGIFGDQKNTTTTGQQSGTSNTTGTNFGNTSQAGRTGSNYDWAIQGGIGGLPNAFAPGIATGQSVAQTGIDPNSISKYMSPYLMQSLQSQLALANQQQGQNRSALSGFAAKQGALTGSGATNARNQSDYLASLSNNNLISQGLNTGFNTAAGLAGQDVNARLAGANLANSGVSSQFGALGNLINLGGTNTANTGSQTGGQNSSNVFSGNTSGTSDTTSFNPFGTLSGLAGGAMKALPFLMAANGGRIPGYALGGDVAKQGAMPLHHDNPKLAKLMGTLEPLMHTMRKAVRNGGKIEGYGDGGDVGLGTWDATVQPAQPSLMDRMGGAANAFGEGYRAMQPQRPQAPQAQPADDSTSLLSSRMADLAKQFQSVRGYGTGGDVGLGSWDARVDPADGIRVNDAWNQPGPGEDTSYLPPPADAPPAAMRLGSPQDGASPASPTADRGILRSIRDYFAHPARQQFASYLASAHGSPFAPSEANALATREADLKAAQLLGNLNGRPTLAAQEAVGAVGGMPTVAARAQSMAEARNPATIAHLEAGSEAAQIRIKMQEAKNAQQLKFYEQQLLREQDIQDQLAMKVIDPQQAEAMRSINRNTPPPDAKFIYDPKSGLTPRQ